MIDIVAMTEAVVGSVIVSATWAGVWLANKIHAREAAPAELSPAVATLVKLRADTLAERREAMLYGIHERIGIAALDARIADLDGQIVKALKGRDVEET